LLIESLGGTYHEVVGRTFPRRCWSLRRSVNATQLVLGRSRRGRFAQILSRGVGVTTTAESGAIDVHLVTHEEVKRGGVRRVPQRAVVAAQVDGFALALVGLPLLTASCWRLGQLNLTATCCSSCWRSWCWLWWAGCGPRCWPPSADSCCSNYFFTPPVRTWTIAARENLLALWCFVVVGILVSAVVDLAARRTREAAQAGAEAQTLATVAGVSARRAAADRAAATVAGNVPAQVGDPAGARPDSAQPGAAQRSGLLAGSEHVGRPAAAPGEGDVDIPVGTTLPGPDGTPLAAAGPAHPGSLCRAGDPGAAPGAPGQEAATAKPLAAADKMRTALLAAVSHDLRSPLSSAKAAITSLRSDEVDFELRGSRRAARHRGRVARPAGRLVANLLT
jgi:two-component system sensor histidine kinase KdpD